MVGRDFLVILLCFYQGVLCAVNSVTEETSPPEVIADKSAKDVARVQGGDSPFCLILSRLEGQRQRIWDKYKSHKKIQKLLMERSGGG